MSEIYLIRHAQASFADDPYDRLSELGLRQAQVLGEYFARLQLRFDSVYCGTLKRQIDTAETVLARMPAAAEASFLLRRYAFNEYDFAAILRQQIPQIIKDDPSLTEILPRVTTDRRAFQKIFERAVIRWISGPYERGEAESWAGYAARIQQGIRDLMSENGPRKRVAVFTSGGCVAMALQMALGVSDTKTIELSWQVRNTSVSILKYSQRGIGLSVFNSVAHLEIQNDAGLLTYR